MKRCRETVDEKLLRDGSKAGSNEKKMGERKKKQTDGNFVRLGKIIGGERVARLRSPLQRRLEISNG